AASAEPAVKAGRLPPLDPGRPASTLELADEEKELARGFFLLSAKPTLFACNVAESDLAAISENSSGASSENAAATHVRAVEAYAQSHFATGAVVISAQIES